MHGPNGRRGVGRGHKVRLGSLWTGHVCFGADTTGHTLMPQHFSTSHTCQKQLNRPHLSPKVLWNGGLLHLWGLLLDRQLSPGPP